jgi:hypothetical protein
MKIDYSPALCNRDLDSLSCERNMDSISIPGRVYWVENMKWSLTVSLVCVNNKGGVIICLFEYIKVEKIPLCSSADI